MYKRQLRAAFGHKELGVYLIAREGGTVAVGNELVPPAGLNVVAHRSSALVPSGNQLFICGGCYYIYDPASGLPDQGIAAGTPFAAIPPQWRCPDCGTDKSTFRPHVPGERSKRAV